MRYGPCPQNQLSKEDKHVNILLLIQWHTYNNKDVHRCYGIIGE